MAAISTENGMMRSAICGTRNSEVCATIEAGTFGRPEVLRIISM